MDIEAVYLKLPVLVQNIICNFEGWRICHNRYNNDFYRRLRKAIERSSWSKEQLFEYRDLQLRKFIIHAATTVPYYRNKFKELGIDPRSIRTIEDLKQLPIITKQTVKDHFNEFISEAVPKSKRILIHTSGTTGSGAHFYTTMESIHEQWAIWWRYRLWHGITMNTWCAYFGGRSVVPISQNKPPFWRYNIPAKQVLFSGYHMSPQTLQYYLDEIKRRKLIWLHGYPSLIALLASYVIDNNIDIGYKIKYITTGAENLLPQQITLIKNAFGILPKQHYGLAEGIANISECECGHLHVDEDFSAVEFICQNNESGCRIVGTNFTNLAMPLIRYDSQDIVTVLPQEDLCSCLKTGRLVANIDGRQEDYIILKNGIKIGRMDHVLKDLINIRETQIYQRKEGEITVRVVKGIYYSEKDENKLIEELKKRVGNDIKIHIEYVKSLPRSPAGKLRFIISDLKEGKMAKSV
ncbi:phenylacetate--CoA ligase family protein [bacterium]|nr:phenylacetate--CoA ligase family protein [bacterium]